MKFSAPHAPVTEVDARTVILLVNSRQMVPLARRYALKMEKVLLATQVMVPTIAAENYSYAGNGRTRQFNKAAQEILVRSRSAVERPARNFKNVFIVQRRSEE